MKTQGPRWLAPFFGPEILESCDGSPSEAWVRLDMAKTSRCLHPSQSRRYEKLVADYFESGNGGESANATAP